MSARLPSVIEELASVAGSDAAWAIARAKGGRFVYIPQAPKRGHWLTKLVGHEKAVLICEHYRMLSGEDRYVGTRLLIPLASAAQEAQRWNEVLGEGMSLADEAREMGVHVRTASRWRERLARKNDRQGSLF